MYSRIGLSECAHLHACSKAKRADFSARLKDRVVSPAFNVGCSQTFRQRRAGEGDIDRFDIRRGSVVAPHEFEAGRKRWLLLKVRIFTAWWRHEIREISRKIAIVSDAEEFDLAANSLQLALHAALSCFLRCVRELWNHDGCEDAENDNHDQDFDEREPATDIALRHDFLPGPRMLERFGWLTPGLSQLPRDE